MRRLFAVVAFVVVAEIAIGQPDNSEALAISALKAINVAQALYSAMCVRGGYAVELSDLKPSFSDYHSFLSPDLSANGVLLRGTYIVTVEKDAAEGVKDIGSAKGTCNSSEHQPVSSYYASATPVMPGYRYFATDTRGTVFVSTRVIPNPIRNGTPIDPRRPSR
jgi:hypothetical protein